MEPTQIKVWDWRYRIGYDHHLHAKVDEIIQRIDRRAERTVMRRLFDWAAGFVSLDSVLDSLRDSSFPIAELGSIDETKLLHVPEELRGFFETKIKVVVEENPRTQAKLYRLLAASIAAPYRPLQRELFSVTFGNELDILLEKARFQEYVPVPPVRPIERADLPALVANFHEFIRSSPVLQRLLLAFPMPSYKTSIIEADTGYAEYWPTELMPGEEEDQLVIYDNPATLDHDTMMATLLHEVYPGHGLFYNVIKSMTPPLFDHGALTLIEGWATWCEWRFFDSEYARHTRSTRLRFLATFDLVKPSEAILCIDRLRDERKALDSRNEQLNLFFQYPGFAASYALGALWLENKLDPSTVDQFFSDIAQRPVGDFFELWSHQGVTSSIAQPSRRRV